MPEPAVTRSDLEEELRRAVGGATTGAASQKGRLAAAAAIGGIALLGIAYLLGRRVGRLRSTVVEIRRI